MPEVDDLNDRFQFFAGCQIRLYHTAPSLALRFGDFCKSVAGHIDKVKDIVNDIKV